MSMLDVVVQHLSLREPDLARAKPLQLLLAPCARLHAVGLNLNHSLFEDGSHRHKATFR